MTRYAQDLILFLLAGLAIGVLIRQRETDSTQPPPDRNGKIVKVPQGYWDVEIAS